MSLWATVPPVVWGAWNLLPMNLTTAVSFFWTDQLREQVSLAAALREFGHLAAFAGADLDAAYGQLTDQVLIIAL